MTQQNNLSIRHITLLLFCLLPISCYAQLDIAPEVDSGWHKTSSAIGSKAMVVTANKHASLAAISILKQGGSAIDAAIAAQAMLGLVEPQSSGIGGGAFLLYWDNENKKLIYYDGRESAPAKLQASHFLLNDNQPMKFFDAVIGGHAVGVPGVLKMLDKAHGTHGKLAWSMLFNDAIATANNGFAVSPRLHTLLNRTPKMSAMASESKIRQLFYLPNGQALPIGYQLKNPDYAQSLSLIAQHGAEVFYSGKLAKQIIRVLSKDPNHPSLMTLDDLRNYQAITRPAACGTFKQYKVCGAAPPSSGGTTMLSILGMLNQFDLMQYPTNSVAFIHLFAEASKLAFADRNKFIGDPDFVDVPTNDIIDPTYLKNRSRLINPSQAAPAAKAGLLHKPQAGWISSSSPELPSTSHISIVDAWGNALSMTTSIETAFGSRVLVGGFLLNNQLTDFSFTPQQNGKLVANRAQGKKRPRSSMSPTIIFNTDNTVKMIVGSPGGSRIIGYTTQAIVNHLAKNMPLAQAIAAPHIIQRNRAFLELEENRFKPAVIENLKQLGHKIKQAPQTSGIHAITFDNNTIIGVADPRREGFAVGF